MSANGYSPDGALVVDAADALAAERARADQAYRNGWLAAAKAVDEYGNNLDAADFSVRNTWEIRDHLIEFAPEAE